MTLLIVAPADRRSALAQHTSLVARHLSRDDDIVWISPPTSDPVPTYGTHQQVEGVDASVLEEVGKFRSRLYVIGGSAHCTLGGEIARAHPGAVILHDVVLFELAGALAASRSVNRKALPLEELTSRLHGHRVVSEMQVEKAMMPRAGTHPAISQRSHFLAYFLHSATVVLTHSEWASARVQQAVAAPTLVARLPSELYGLKHSRDADQQDPRTRHHIVIPGMVNRHKMVDVAIRAYARSRLRAQGHDLIILGMCPPNFEAYLRLLARREGVEDAVRFSSPASDGDFDAQLASARAVVVLRESNTEAQSAALLAALSSGSPVIASSGGCFGEVPSHLLESLPQEHTTEALTAILDELDPDDPRVASRSEEALAWVRETHAIGPYVEEVLRALELHRKRVNAVASLLAGVNRLRFSGSHEIPGSAAALGHAFASLGLPFHPWDVGA